MLRLRNYSISIRFYMTIALVVVGLSLLIFQSLNQVEKMIIQNKLENTQAVVGVTVGILKKYYQLQQKGVLTEDQAKADAKEDIGSIRYGKDNYFWIHNRDLVMLMHPANPSVVGNDMTFAKDSNGKHHFQAMQNVVNQSGFGFVDYQWQAAGESTLTKKKSYVQLFEPWGWVVGSGVVLNDMDTLFWMLAKRPLVIGLIIVLCVTFFTFCIGRSITRPLNATTEAMFRIASSEGDLTQRLSDHSKDEVGLLTSSFNAFVDKIETTIMQLKNNTSDLATAFNELATIANSSQSAAEQQNSEILSVASAISQMAQTITEVAKNTEQASMSANLAKDEAQSSQSIAREAADSVNELSDDVARTSSIINQLIDDTLKITRVIDVINDIAEKTNLLALNAAIEAARAGEQGRGFAVVADEVRTLAAQTKQSTDEVQHMISAIHSRSDTAIEAMQKGNQIMQKTVSTSSKAGESLVNIVSAVNEISDMNLQVASAAEEQAMTAQEIEKSVTSISGITSDSFHLIKNTNNAIADVNALGNKINTLVNQFKVSA